MKFSKLTSLTNQAMMELTSGSGIGRICECSGNAGMLNSCFSYLRKGGRVVLIGLPKQPIHVEHPLPDICKTFCSIL
jgi:threonine dehydrogenase-like Zn-dependent dehydrogenase